MQLDKDTPEHISSSWENAILLPGQLQYAAKDVYASLHIYEELSKIPIPSCLPSSVPPMMPVLLYSTNNTTIIAEGQISHLHDCQTYDGVCIFATCVVIDILRVLIPGTIITTHHQQSLSSFWHIE